MLNATGPTRLLETEAVVIIFSKIGLGGREVKWIVDMEKKKNTVHHIDFLYNSNVTNNKFNYGNVDGVVQCGWAVQ